MHADMRSKRNRYKESGIRTDFYPLSVLLFFLKDTGRLHEAEELLEKAVEIKYVIYLSYVCSLVYIILHVFHQLINRSTELELKLIAIVPPKSFICWIKRYEKRQYHRKMLIS